MENKDLNKCSIATMVVASALLKAIVERAVVIPENLRESVDNQVFNKVDAAARGVAQ